MRVSVLIPTFRRPLDFERCLMAIEHQERIPDEVVVVARDNDRDSQAVLARWLDHPFVRVVPVAEGGQVQALNAGLDMVTGEIVMITDDDAAPYPDWCARVEQHFVKNQALGGVGGRDIVQNPEGPLDGYCSSIGRVQPWGRIVGNHHLTAPEATFVHLLKGANMSYRMAAVGDLRFDTKLRGAGAQVGNDMAFSMAIARRGWKLLYDPAVRVDHYPAQRFENEKRNERNLASAEYIAFNTWWTLTHHLRPGPRRSMALLWECMIGTSGHPGWLRGWIARIRRNEAQFDIFTSAHNGRREARRLSRGA